MSSTSDVRVSPAARWIAVLVHTVLVASVATFLFTRSNDRDDSVALVVVLLLAVIDLPVSLLTVLTMSQLADRIPVAYGIGVLITMFIVLGGLYHYWLIGFVGRILLRRRPAWTMGHTGRRSAGIAVVVALMVAAIPWGVRAWNIAHDPAKMPYAAPAVAFAGDSRDLKRSVVVPTLDTPLPEGKNAIWCATFQMAWDHLKDDVVGEPILLQGAQELAGRLNQSAYPPSGIEESDYYATAGWTKDGIVERIRADMRKRFDKEPMGLGGDDDAAVAYAYLRARVPFTFPYFENDKEFLFIDSSGEKTSVSSFGIREDESYAYYQLRRQLRVLYTPRDCTGHTAREFAVDLCEDSAPYQIVLACVPRQESLETTLRYVEKKAAEEPGSSMGNHPICDAVVLIPNLSWSIEHHFTELTGTDKRLLNKSVHGLYVKEAVQVIDFRLDRSGADLGSEAKIAFTPIPINYIADRPFLLYITKRGGGRPFFVMWVDNAELLSKRQ